MAVPITKAYSSRTVVKTYTKVLDVSSSFSGAAAGTGEVSAGLLVELEYTSAAGEVQKMYAYNIFGANMRLLISYGVESTPLVGSDSVDVGH